MFEVNALALGILASAVRLDTSVAVVRDCSHMTKHESTYSHSIAVWQAY